MTTQPLRALVVEDDHCGSKSSVRFSRIAGWKWISLEVWMKRPSALRPNRSLAVVDLSLSPNDHNNYDGLRVLDAVRRLTPIAARFC